MKLHSKMFFLLPLLFIVFPFISHQHVASAASYTTLVAPVSKHTDASKPLYSAEIGVTNFRNSNFILDLDAPFIWYDCIVKLGDTSDCPSNTSCGSPVTCDEYQCTDVRTSYSYNNPSCSPDGENNTTMLHFLDFQICACPINVVNPMNGLCSQALLDYDVFVMSFSDGRNVIDKLEFFYPNVGCAPRSTFASFPANVSGVMGLSSSLYAFPRVYWKGTFAICFPSNTSARGVIFYGTGPFYLLPQSNVDVTSYLSYTPLLNHQDSFGYFIRVDSIVIKKRSITIPANATTKLTTINPYTMFRTDIYNAVVRRFSLVTKRLLPAKPIAPFSLCFNTSTTGLKVPDIDFNIPDGKKWTVSTTNSIIKITNDVACLAFVDGGAMTEHAIVIGSFQFEDNLLVFDVDRSTLGFSSSLLRKKTSCSNFNFTVNNP